MILATLGKLAVAQQCPAGTATDMTNVIAVHADGAGKDYSNLTDLWWVVDTYSVATGNDSDTYKFALVAAKEATLDNIKEVLSVTITDFEDKRIATAGRHIVAVNIGKMLKDFLEADGSDYEFVGMIATVSAGAEVYINAALSPSEPQTLHHKMVTESGVTVPEIASVGSGV